MAQNIIQSPCVTALVLSEGTNSNMRLSEQLWAEQLWAEQLRTWYNLDLLHLSLCSGSDSLSEGMNSTTLLHEQLWTEQL